MNEAVQQLERDKHGRIQNTISAYLSNQPELRAEFERMRTAQLVKHEKTAVGEYRCPSCNAAFFSGIVTNYCGNCGQKLIFPK